MNASAPDFDLLTIDLPYDTATATIRQHTQLLAARSTPPEPERKVTAEGEAHAMHYVADGNKGVMYAVVTAPAYHSR